MRKPNAAETTAVLGWDPLGPTSILPHVTPVAVGKWLTFLSLHFLGCELGKATNTSLMDYMSSHEVATVDWMISCMPLISSILYHIYYTYTVTSKCSKSNWKIILVPKKNCHVWSCKKSWKYILLKKNYACTFIHSFIGKRRDEREREKIKENTYTQLLICIHSSAYNT